jgi:AcrR family transcriptional regulator
MSNVRKQTSSDVAARRNRVLDAASNAFFRYGYAKTTLGDIAEEANLHRPALYALFPEGKDELFEAVLLRLVESKVEQYRREISKRKTLRRKILYCVEDWGMDGFRLTDTHPDARDAFNMAYPAVRKMYEVLTSFYAELLREAVAASALKLSAEQLAQLLIFSLRGIKDIAEGAESLHQLLIHEVDLFIAALSARGSAPST